jgi:carboxylesterase
MYKWFARLFHFRQRSPFGIKDGRIRNVVIESIKGAQYGMGGGLLWEFKALVGEVKPRLAMISQPTHIFHSREDDQSDLATAETIARALGGPVDLTILDDSYHLVTFDRQRSVVVERTVEIVSRLAERNPERGAVLHLAESKAIVDNCPVSASEAS